MQDLRKGIFDVLIGVNLLREGLDLPEVSLVAILDADKEGFLRSNRSLTQTVGRAARHLNGKAIMYADKVTASMGKTIEETSYRREKQLAYNAANNIKPTALKKSLDNALAKNSVSTFHFEKELIRAAEPDPAYLTSVQREKLIREKAEGHGKSRQGSGLYAGSEITRRNQDFTGSGIIKKRPEYSGRSLTNQLNKPTITKSR